MIKRPSVKRVFFNTPLIMLLVLLLTHPASVSSDESGYLFTMDLGDRYRLVERQNLRVRENGIYKGFLYREYRAFLRNPGRVPGRYEGEYYILENLKRNAAMIAKAVDNELDASFRITEFGIMQVPKESTVPIHRDFPAFSPKPVRIGASWDVSGSDLVFDSKGVSVRVPFLCRYIFRGEDRYLNRPVAVIDAQYALRYDQSSYTYKPGRIKKISGSRKAVIMLYTDAAGGIFIRSQLKQQIVYSTGGSEET